MIRRLITDQDILQGLVTSPIVLDEGTLLTPAARDRARLRGMVIVERDAVRSGAGAAVVSAAALVAAPGSTGHPGPAVVGGRARCARCDGCGCDTGGTSGLADGLYLVRVEAGRTVSMLPATGPGQMTPRSARLR